MAKIISFINHKGGCGKTTSTFYVAVSLAKKGKRVLMIDLDIQASLTILSGLEPYSIDQTIISIMANPKTSIQSCIQALHKNLHIITSRFELAVLEKQLISRESREGILLRALESVKNNYDYILLDCPPNLNILTTNAFACTNYIVVPVKTDYLSYRALGDLKTSLEESREFINPDIEELGILATMYDQRIKADQDILKLLKKETTVLGIIKNLAVVKNEVYNGLPPLDQPPKNSIEREYDKVSDYIIKKGGI